ncbi:hypothetical protein Tco_1512554, partial [Tanacetum coccineum]
EKYTIEERAIFLAEFFDQRKKQLAAARAEAIKNKPPTKTQVRNKMTTYLKHIEEQESPKSDEEAATDYEYEKEELRMWLTVVSDEEETVDPKILSAKYPIVDWESQNLGIEYPLIKEMLQKMLNWKLEAEAESTMAFELLKFIKSQLEE